MINIFDSQTTKRHTPNIWLVLNIVILNIIIGYINSSILEWQGLLLLFFNGMLAGHIAACFQMNHRDEKYRRNRTL